MATASVEISSSFFFWSAGAGPAPSPLAAFESGNRL